MGSAILTMGWARMGSCLFALDFCSVDFLVSLRSFLQLEFLLLAFGIAISGFSMPALDFVTPGSSLSLRSHA